ncbi:hypothetical protein KAR34_09325 [bacterium]|nr:hypothetical protein [bacterium]
MAQKCKAETEDKNLRYGRQVKVLNGSARSMPPDTPENQLSRPRAKKQKPGCGFPMMRIVALCALMTGAMPALARDSLSVHERTRFRTLWKFFNPKDVLLPL